MKLFLCLTIALVAALSAEAASFKRAHLEAKVPRFHPLLRRVNPRITGGDEVVPHSRPYQAALLLHAEDGSYFCGGSLISPTTVITAAHCGELTDNVEVILGAHNITGVEDTQVRINASKVLIHPEWNRLELINDIALITLSEAVELNDNIQTIKLPTNLDNNYEGDEATASGWGKPSDAADGISDVLREVTTPVSSNLICSLYYLGLITDDQVCTNTDGGKSTCNGDSGGPLVSSEGDLIGLTSFGISLGCEIGWPAVFTRVTSYVDWIKANSDVEI